MPRFNYAVLPKMVTTMITFSDLLLRIPNDFWSEILTTIFQLLHFKLAGRTVVNLHVLCDVFTLFVQQEDDLDQFAITFRRIVDRFDLLLFPFVTIARH